MYAGKERQDQSQMDRNPELQIKSSADTTPSKTTIYLLKIIFKKHLNSLEMFLRPYREWGKKYFLKTLPNLRKNCENP